jgi:hypothetical protein
MFRAWNRGADAGSAWAGYWSQYTALADHARRWAPELAQHQDLTAVLVEFCGLRLQ